VKRGCAPGDRRPARPPSEGPTAPAERQSCRIGVAPFGGGAVLHDPQTGRLFQLNHSAARVWRSFRAGELEEVIVDDLAVAHDVAPAVVRRDLRAFVDALEAAGLSWRREASEGHDAEEEVRPPAGPPALAAVYQVGEVALRVVCHPDDVATAFVPLAAPARVSDDAAVEGCLTLFRDRGTFVLMRDDRVVERLNTAPAARWALVRQLVSTARRGPCLALLHAGAVMTPAGCLLICGESGAGKSTLLAGLLHGGFAFIADDIVHLDEGGGIGRPVRLAISIKQNSWSLVGSLFPELASAPTIRFGDRTMRYIWPSGAALADHASGHSVAAVLFPLYAEDTPAVLSRLDPVRSLALLGEGGSALPSGDIGLVRFLSWWSAVPAYQLSYGRLHEAVRKVSELADALRNDHGPAAPSAPASGLLMSRA
jgi:coenzyme PQQ synthesis protein D (PqqD)